MGCCCAPGTTVTLASCSPPATTHSSRGTDTHCLIPPRTHRGGSPRPIPTVSPASGWSLRSSSEAPHWAPSHWPRSPMAMRWSVLAPPTGPRARPRHDKRSFARRLGVRDARPRPTSGVHRARESRVTSCAGTLWVRERRSTATPYDQPRRRPCGHPAVWTATTGHQFVALTRCPCRRDLHRYVPAPPAVSLRLPLLAPSRRRATAAA